MKTLLSILMILSALPAQAFDSTFDARCRELLTSELKKAVELNPEFVREAALAKQAGSDLVIKNTSLQIVARGQSSTDFTAVGKVYVASSREDDPAQYERLKFTFGVVIGRTVSGGCFIAPNAPIQKTLR